MAANKMSQVILNLRRTALGLTGAGLTDAQLLEHYVSRQDGAAFEAIVRRHGPMVLGVCRRILRNESDAEDAFQATFLVLIRKAATVRSRDAVGNWLYGVAYNTALKVKAMNAKRRIKEREAGSVPKSQVTEEVWKAVQVLLDKELIGLPEKFRIPIVLCDLEGKTIKEATLQLGWPQGTVASRLVRGRALLAQRLREHGLILSAGVLAAAVSQECATASVPPALMLSTIKATSLWTAEKAAVAGVFSVKVVGIAEGVTQAMFLTKLKSILVVGLMAITILGIGSGGVMQFTSVQDFAGSVAQAEKKPPATPQAKEADDPTKLKREIERLQAELAKTRLELQRAQYASAIMKAQADAELAKSRFELQRAQDASAIMKAQADFAKPKDKDKDKNDAIVSNRRTFNIPFQIDASARKEMKRLELLVSKDHGLSWAVAKRCFPSEADDSCRFTAPADGVYWFAFRIESKKGEFSPERIQPTLTIVVHTTK